MALLQTEWKEPIRDRKTWDKTVRELNGMVPDKMLELARAIAVIPTAMTVHELIDKTGITVEGGKPGATVRNLLLALRKQHGLVEDIAGDGTGIAPKRWIASFRVEGEARTRKLYANRQQKIQQAPAAPKQTKTTPVPLPQEPTERGASERLERLTLILYEVDTCEALFEKVLMQLVKPEKTLMDALGATDRLDLLEKLVLLRLQHTPSQK